MDQHANDMNIARKSKVILRSTRGQSVGALVRDCLELCNWREVVPRDAAVVVKPNLCTAVAANAAMSNTSIEITAAVCEVLTERTGRIIVGESDNLRQKAQDAFEVSGYSTLARIPGVRLVNFSEEPVKRVACAPAGEIELPRCLLEADVFVTLPVLKTHALTYFTGTLKNQWGCVPQYDRILLHRHLDPLLALLNALFQPKLAVMDGIIGMEGRGPVNGKPRRLDLILASRDPVALDATAMRLVGLDPAQSRHVVLAAEKGVGTMCADDITVDGDFESLATKFEPAVLDAAVAAMNYMSRHRWFVKHILEPDAIFRSGRALVQWMRKVGVVEGGSQVS